MLEGSSEQDPVATRKHVETIGDHDVVHLGLGEQECELALDRPELLVAEEGLRSEARAVDDHGLGKPLYFLAAPQLPDHDPPPRQTHLAHHRAEIDRGLDQHGGEASGVAGGKGVLVRPQLAAFGIEVADEALLPPLAKRLLGQDVVLEPADAELGGGKPLEGAVGEAGRTREERVGLGRAPVSGHDGGGAPLAARDVRGRVGREVFRIDRDLRPALLQQAGRGQTHRAAAQNREALLPGPPGLVHGQLRGAPGERDPATPVAVVVNDGRVAELFRPDHETRRPEGPEADHRPDDPVLRDVHPREAARPLGPCERASSPARASGEAGAQGSQAGGLEHGPPRRWSRDHHSSRPRRRPFMGLAIVYVALASTMR